MKATELERANYLSDKINDLSLFVDLVKRSEDGIATKFLKPTFSLRRIGFLYNPEHEVILDKKTKIKVIEVLESSITELQKELDSI